MNMNERTPYGCVSLSSLSDFLCDKIFILILPEMLSPNSLVKRQSYRSEHVVDMLCIDDSDSEDAISVGKETFKNNFSIQ